MATPTELTVAEVKKHNTKDNIWFIIHGVAYDVTKFLDEHPGGEEVLLENAGQDATEAFEDVGHSSEARNMLKQYAKGKVVDAASGASPKAKSADFKAPPPATSSSSNILMYFVPIVVAIGIAYAVFGRA